MRINIDKVVKELMIESCRKQIDMIQCGSAVYDSIKSVANDLGHNVWRDTPAGSKTTFFGVIEIQYDKAMPPLEYRKFREELR